MESQNCSGWKRPAGSSSPTFNQTAPCPIKHITPSQGGGRDEERATHCCSVRDLPSARTRDAFCLFVSILFPILRSFLSFCEQESIVHSQQRRLKLLWLLIWDFLCISCAHAKIWIFNGKSTRSGSLLPFVRCLGSSAHTWEASGVLSWCLLAWRHGDRQGHSQAGWLQSTVPLQTVLCLEAHPVELEKKRTIN